MANEENLARPGTAKRAVAMKYAHEDEELPRIVAKGMGALAELIERLAEAHGVPVARHDDLAKLLTDALPDINHETDEYKVLAEVICYLYYLESKAS